MLEAEEGCWEDFMQEGILGGGKEKVSLVEKEKDDTEEEVEKMLLLWSKKIRTWE